MDSFTIGLRSPWWIRAFCRNPLVRGSDRVEALALVFATVLTIVAVPIAGAFATSVHDDRSRAYAQEALSKHQVTATASEDGQLVPALRSVIFAAEATWSDAGSFHRAIVPWNDRAKVGDQQRIWVNEAGDNVAPPSSSRRAAGEALTTALLIWLGVAEASTALVYAVRRRLNHQRYAAWDRELNTAGDNGGRRNQQS
jgi:hypothetical protein